MTRFALLALGSRGDVQPFVALGLALLARGHSVRLLAAADYEPLCDAYGIPFAAIGGSIAELMNPAAALDALDAARSPLPIGFARRFADQVGALLPGLAADAWRACQGAQVIVASTLGVFLGEHIAERLGVPLIPAHFHPVGATGHLPDVNFPVAPRWMPLGGLYHRLTHALTPHTLRQLLYPALNRARTTAIGLPPLSRLGYARLARRKPPLTLYGYSATLLARPVDWPPWRVLTGPWLLDAPEGYTPPLELERFLASGPPPVYVGFGSILAGRDPRAMVELLVAALAQAGRRGLIYRGAWGDLAADDLPEDVLSIGDVPHAWLFPRVAAVITHGGAGTVAAALAAGASPIIVPAFGDQYLWGRRIAELGAGPLPLPRSALSVEALARAISRALEPERRERAAHLGAQLVAEHGAARAAEALEGLAV
jgi:UDP:flavonoid glycosyltransferase YjiC (YdhE family)